MSVILLALIVVGALLAAFGDDPPPRAPLPREAVHTILRRARIRVDRYGGRFVARNDVAPGVVGEGDTAYAAIRECHVRAFRFIQYGPPL